MRNNLTVYLLLAAVLSLSSCASVGNKRSSAPAKTSDEKFHEINLITKKLHGMHESNEHLDILEREGMKKSDVNRIRRAIDKKIDQLTDETVDLIEAL